MVASCLLLGYVLALCGSCGDMSRSSSNRQGLIRYPELWRVDESYENFTLIG